MGVTFSILLISETEQYPWAFSKAMSCVCLSVEYRRRCTWASQLEAGKPSRADLALCHWVASTPKQKCMMGYDSDHEGGKRMCMNNAWVKKERLHEANENNLLVVC